MSRSEALSGRWRLSGRIETVTSLHVGAGKSAGALDSDDPILKDFRGRPFVPGSSLRGALRAAIESLLRSAGLTSLACDPIEAPCPRPASDFEPELGSNARERERRWQRSLSTWTSDQVHSASCAVCRLFGSRQLPSRLAVRDLAVDLSTWTEQLLSHRETVALDRDSETAVEAHRRSFEAVPPAVSFSMELTIDNPRESVEGQADDLGLLALAIEQLDGGWITLGGRRGAGLGRVRVHLSVLEMTNARMLLSGSPPERVSGAALDELISRHRERAGQSFMEATHVSHSA